MKASQVTKPKEKLRINEIEIPNPKGRQVIVKVESSEVCHSDIHVWQGGLGLAAIQIVKALFNPTIIAIDLNDDLISQHYVD